MEATEPMDDIEVFIDNRPGGLARMGEVLGAAGIGVDGGAMFLVDDRAIAHFLVEDGPAAQAALEEAGIRVGACRQVLVVRFGQDRPGQLGVFGRRMADAGVNIETFYSDHENRRVLVVDEPEAGRRVSDTWQG